MSGLGGLGCDKATAQMAHQQRTGSLITGAVSHQFFFLWFQEEEIDKMTKVMERRQQAAAFLGFLEGKQDAEIKVSL